MEDLVACRTLHKVTYQASIRVPHSSTSMPGSGATSPTTVASPGTGVPSSVSPTSARRAPPGSLGPMPPSIFANMSSNAQLPNPPAAAAAAVAAGYSIDGEAKDGLSPNQSVPGEAYGSDSAGSAGGGLASRRTSTAVQPDAHAKTIKATFDQEDARPTSKVYPLVSDVAAEELPERGLTNLLVELFYCKGTDSRLQFAGQL